MKLKRALLPVKPWHRLRTTKEHYLKCRPWKKARMDRERYEQMILTIDQEIIDDIRIELETELLLEKAFGKEAVEGEY